MVTSTPGHDVFDRSKLPDGSLGLVAGGGRSENPNITGGKLDSGRTTANWEPSEVLGKWFREDNDIGSDLCRGLGGHTR